MSKKITTELNAFRKLVRMRDFIVANRERFGAETPAAKAVSGVISTVTNLRKLTTEQAAHTADGAVPELLLTMA